VTILKVNMEEEMLLLVLSQRYAYHVWLG